MGEREANKDVNIVTGVAVVVRHSEKPGKILVVRESETLKSYGKKKGMHSLPTGRVRNDEFVVNSVVREALEEGGYDVKVDGFLGLYQIEGALGVVVTATASGEKKEINDPGVKDSMWVDVERVLRSSFETRPANKRIIKDFVEGKVASLDLIKDCR